MHSEPLLVILLAACGAQPPQVAETTFPISREGLSHFGKAKVFYGNAQGGATSPQEHLRGLEAAHQSLELAIATDPRCILFYTKAAELCIDLAMGQLTEDSARHWLNRAAANLDPGLAGAENAADLFVPFWLARARLATLAKDFVTADRELVNAKHALEALQSGPQRGEGNGGSLILSLVDLIAGIVAPADDRPSPVLPETERRRLLFSMLSECEEWRPDNAGLLTVQKAGAKQQQGVTNLLRRLEARVLVGRLDRDLATPGGVPADQAMARLRDILDFDGSNYPARRALARYLTAAGRYRDALAQLVRVASREPADAWIANHPGEQLLLVGIHLARWLAEKSPEALRDAAEYAQFLATRGIEVHPDEQDWALARAALLFFRGLSEHDRSKLGEAARVLERAAHPDDAEAAARLLADVRAAMAAVAKGTRK